MKARLLGFIWEPKGGVTLDELFSEFKNKEGKQKDFSGFQRLLYVGDITEYRVGVFLTIKDQRKIPEIRLTEGEEYKITIRDIEEGSNILDFNFFIINRNTNRGIYQYYHHSCSLGQFAAFCRLSYNRLRDSKKDAAIRKLGASPSSAKLKAARAPFKGTLDSAVMVRPEKLEQLLDEISIVKSFEFELATLSSKEKLLRPLSPHVRLERHSVGFKRKTKMSTVKRDIVKFIAGRKIQSGAFHGIDDDGVPKILKLMDNPDYFGEEEYDDLADEVVLNVSAIEKSPFLKQMYDVAKTYKAMFEQIAK